MKEKAYPWQFRARFRKAAFGWKSQPAITRVKEAVSEIKKMARTDPALAAEGAVLFLEKVSNALEQVDSSSGAIGSAVYKAVSELAKIIGAAPAAVDVRARWMDRLWQAQQADMIPYIECLGGFWGQACGSAEVASLWADAFLPGTRRCFSSSGGGYYQGCANCLSSLLAAGRHEELLKLLEITPDYMDPGQYRMEVLLATGRTEDALQDPSNPELAEEILLKQGRSEEAYRRFGLVANQKSTNLATFRAIRKKYPDIPPEQILHDLVAQNPEAAGKWFAAAKDARLYALALDLATQSPSDPKTLNRAARDFAETEPEFALGASLLALHWLVEGYGYDIIGLDVYSAYLAAAKAATRLGREDEVKSQIQVLLGRERPGGFVNSVLKGLLPSSRGQK